MRKPKNSKDALEFIHTLDSLAIKKQKEEIARLKAEVERLDTLCKQLRMVVLYNDNEAKEGKQS